jgi:hypothetical protein
MLINLLVLYDMPENKTILQTVCKKIIGLILCKLYKSGISCVLAGERV